MPGKTSSNPPRKQDRVREKVDPRPDGLSEIVERITQIAAQNEQLFRRLAEGEQRFRGLARAVWKVQEEERRRLARELHDGIGQALTALINQLQRHRQLGDGHTQRMLEDSIGIAQQALADVREMSRLLRPPVLDDLGLHAGLSWLVRTMREHAGLVTAFDWEAADDARFDPELETLVFRVVQEGLNNVVKHSGVREAHIGVRHGNAHLEIEIADTGKGFEPRKALPAGNYASGLGLRGMRDRVELFGGKLEVAAAPGRGSRLHVSIPLSSP